MSGAYYYGWNKRLSHKMCQKIIDIGKGNWKRGKVVNTSVVPNRKNDVVWTKEQWIYNIIWPYMIEANACAEWKYDIVGAEACQVTRYTKDGFYSWHRDGIGSHNELLYGNVRKLSMTIVLNSDFEGGDFEMVGEGERGGVPRLEEGSVIVFPSFIEHRVTPVTKGIRYSLVAWFVGQPFK